VTTPAGYANPEVFVAPVPLSGQALYVRRQRDIAAAQRAKADAWEEVLRQPDGMAAWMEEIMGMSVGDFVRKSPRLAEDVRSRMLAGIAEMRSAPPPGPVEHLAVLEQFEGFQRAGLVAVNIHDASERPAAEQLAGGSGAAVVRRLRRWWPISKTRATRGGKRLPPGFAEAFVRTRRELPVSGMEVSNRVECGADPALCEVMQEIPR